MQFIFQFGQNSLKPNSLYVKGEAKKQAIDI